MWEQLLEVINNNWQVESFAVVLGLFVTFGLGSLATIAFSWQRRQRFLRGIHNSTVVVQQVVIADNRVGYRDIMASLSVDQVCPDEEGARHLLRLVSQCRPSAPSIPFSGRAGGNVLSSLNNLVEGATAGRVGTCRNMVMFVICHDPSGDLFWGSSKIRVLLVSAKDLVRIVRNGKSLSTELPRRGHQAHLAILAQLGKQFLELRRTSTKSPAHETTALLMGVGRFVQATLPDAYPRRLS